MAQNQSPNDTILRAIAENPVIQAIVGMVLAVALFAELRRRWNEGQEHKSIMSELREQNAEWSKIVTAYSNMIDDLQDITEHHIKETKDNLDG